MAYEIMLQAYGWEKGLSVVMRLGANMRGFSRKASDVPKDISLGQAVYGLAIDFYALSQIARDGHEKLGFVLPEGLTVINPDAMAILKGAPHRELAQAFVDFVMSERGQMLWILPPGAEDGPVEHALSRIPIMPSLITRHADRSIVKSSVEGFEASFTYDSDKDSKRRGLVNDLIGVAIIDSHDELVAAWKAVIKGGAKPALIAELCAPPNTEAEVTAMAEKWSDAEFRNSQLNKWTTLFVERYKRITSTAK